MAARPTFMPSFTYANPLEALKWVGAAFRFKATMLIPGRSGEYRADEVHEEMSFGDSVIMIGGEWTEQHKSPISAGEVTTPSVHVHLDEDIDAHCDRARAAGATIVGEPEDHFHGDRTYRAADLEGHLWTFGQTVRKVSREEAEEASRLKIEGWV